MYRGIIRIRQSDITIKTPRRETAKEVSKDLRIATLNLKSDRDNIATIVMLKNDHLVYTADVEVGELKRMALRHAK